MSDFGFREASGRSSVWLWIEGIEDQRRIALAHFLLVRCLHLTPSACVCETERRNVILDVGFCEQQAMALDAIVAEQLLAEARRFLTAEASSAEQPAALLPSSAPPLDGPLAAAAADALDDVRQAAIGIGLQLQPLRTPGEVTILLEVELLYPHGVPKRSSLVLEELRARGVHSVPTEFELERLLDHLDASDGWAQAKARLFVPSEKRCVLVPPVTRCVVCGCTAFDDARKGRSTWVRRRSLSPRPARGPSSGARALVTMCGAGGLAGPPALVSGGVPPPRFVLWALEAVVNRHVSVRN